MKITILDDYQHVIEGLDCYKLLEGLNVEIIHEYINDLDILSQRLQDTEILVLTRERTAISEDLLKRLAALKLISQPGKISNHIDLNACNKYRVAIAEGIGSPIAPAELSWALLMNTLRKIPQAIEGMKKGLWQTNIGDCVYGKTIGIWGYGKIGQRMAQYAKAFGAQVLVCGSDASREKAVQDGFKAAIDRTTFFSQADIVSLHLRLNEQTYGIVKEKDLLAMRANAVLINTSRAELIEKGALQSVIRSRPDLSFGLDVYEFEPIFDADFPLFNAPNIVCTPRLGYVEKNSYELYFRKAFENVIAFFGGNPTSIFNPDVLKA
ncbi:MAG TPA: D-2-hydroxyacid dehydrogenase family protein [Saprospiraceae bacterium]|nr:D-2-hydroxyacid dehydrogenase family protein [Saprospiraceae bacterium]